MDFPVPSRKKNRLSEYDYRQGGAYYVTICTKYKRCILGKVIDGDEEPFTEMSEYGKTVETLILSISEKYPTVEVVRYCVMPNHVHLLLYFDPKKQNPVLSTLINQFKGAVSKATGESIWQKGYYDHVIRTESDYSQIGSYIEHNASKWRSDENYVAPER